jgi:hypothetical protein
MQIALPVPLRTEWHFYFSFNRQFTLGTTAGTAHIHSPLLFNFQAFYLQAIVGLYPQISSATVRADQNLRYQQLDISLAVMAPTLRFLFHQMQFAAFGQGVTTHHVETKAQRLRFHAGKCANFKPHRCNTLGTMLASLLLHYFHRMLAQDYFVHLVSAKGDKTRCINNTANMMPSRN